MKEPQKKHKASEISDPNQTASERPPHVGNDQNHKHTHEETGRKISRNDTH